MCGIFAYISKTMKSQINNDNMHENFENMKNRGPDNTQYLVINNVALGFHRLCINDLSDAGNQPMNYKDYYYH